MVVFVLCILSDAFVSDAFVTQLNHNANVIYSELKWIMNPLHRFYCCVLLPDNLYHYGDDFHSCLD